MSVTSHGLLTPIQAADCRATDGGVLTRHDTDLLSAASRPTKCSPHGARAGPSASRTTPARPARCRHVARPSRPALDGRFPSCKSIGATANREDAVRVVRTLDDGEFRDVRPWTLSRVGFRHLHRALADLGMWATGPTENLNADLARPGRRQGKRQFDAQPPRPLTAPLRTATGSSRLARPPARRPESPLSGLRVATTRVGGDRPARHLDRLSRQESAFSRCMPSDPRTTMRYNRARASLGRHATCMDATYVAAAAEVAPQPHLGSRSGRQKRPDRLRLQPRYSNHRTWSPRAIANRRYARLSIFGSLIRRDFISGRYAWEVVAYGTAVTIETSPVSHRHGPLPPASSEDTL